MSALGGWVLPILVWVAVTLGARGWMVRLGLVRCRAGDWGTAFLAGFTLHTGLVYAAALAGIPFGWTLHAASALVVGGSGLAAGRGRVPPPAPEVSWTPAERILLAALGVYAGIVLLGALYHPITAVDAHSYDGRGRYMLHDRSLDIALYHWTKESVTAVSNLVYPPLYSIGLSVAWAFGGWQSKILTGLMSLAWPLLLYGSLRQSIPRAWALFWTLLAAFTPEVLAHASFALLNVPAMALAAAEAIALARFLEGGERKWILPAGLFAAGTAGVRPDGLLVHAALASTAFAMALARRDLRAGAARWIVPLLAAAAAPLLTWGTWTLALHGSIGIPRTSPFSGDAHFGAGAILGVLPRMAGHFPTYGFTFYAWVLTVPFVAFAARRHGAALPHHAFTATVAAALVLLFGSLSTSYGGGADVVNSSMKRALFYLVPLAVHAAALSDPWRALAGRGAGRPGHGPPSVAAESPPPSPRSPQ